MALTDKRIRQINAERFAAERQRDAEDAAQYQRDCLASWPEVEIPATFYDGLLHQWSFEIGADFIAKRDALVADGFTYRIGDGALEAYKGMAL